MSRPTIDFTNTDIGRREHRKGECMWYDQMIEEREAAHAKRTHTPKRILPRRKRSAWERITTAYRRFVGRP